MNIGDQVTRKWKPELGVGKIKHLLGDSAAVLWYKDGSPAISIEKIKFLKVKDEDR